jgi:hypothetical protein
MLVGWILGTQPGQPPLSRRRPSCRPHPQRRHWTSTCRALERQANDEPTNAAIRVDLGNIYFSERFDMASSGMRRIEDQSNRWREHGGGELLLLNQIDRALARVR